MTFDFFRRPAAARWGRMAGGASGLLVAFFAFGCAAVVSGAAAWAGFYLGARHDALAALAQATAVAGFAAGAGLPLALYARRCRRGATDVPGRAILAACLALPAGNLSWAVLVDATAWHHGVDVVRPAFDVTIMYLILGGLPVLTLGVPWALARLKRQATISG